MLEISAIDDFLSVTLRLVHEGNESPWPQDRGEEWQEASALAAVRERIEFHGIAVLLHSSSRLLSQWPAHLLTGIADEARLMGLWETTHRIAIARLIDTLASHNIESVLMKGTAVAYSMYDDPAARRRGDSDLLIRPSDLDATRALLLSTGWYRDSDPHGLTYQEGWLFDSAGAFVHSLDLHWEPSDSAVLQRFLRSEDMFATRQELPGLSPCAWRAETPLLLIHETMNQKWHEAYGYWTDQGPIKGARRLIWSMDFNLLTQSMGPDDWHRLMQLCEPHGIGPLIADTLKQASSDLNTSLPADFIQALEQQSQDQAILDYFAARDSFDAFWLNLSQARGIREKWAIIRKRGFPPRAHLHAKYPAHAGWPTPLLQARLLLETAGQLMRRRLSN